MDFSRRHRRPLFWDCSNRRASTRQCSRTTGYQHDGHVCNISWWRMIVGLHADSSAISTFLTTQFVVQTRSLLARRLVSQCSRVTTVYHRWYRHTHLNRPYFTLFAHSTTDYDDLCSNDLERRRLLNTKLPRPTAVTFVDVVYVSNKKKIKIHRRLSSRSLVYFFQFSSFFIIHISPCLPLVRSPLKIFGIRVGFTISFPPPFFPQQLILSSQSFVRRHAYVVAARKTKIARPETMFKGRRSTSRRTAAISSGLRLRRPPFYSTSFRIWLSAAHASTAARPVYHTTSTNVSISSYARMRKKNSRHHRACIVRNWRRK